MPVTVIDKANQKFFLLTTEKTAYAIGKTTDDQLIQLYWGAILPRSEDYPPIPQNGQVTALNSTTYNLLADYPVQVGVQEIEPCLRVIFSDTTRDLRLSYTDYSLNEEANSLTLQLKDAFYPLELKLHYQIYSDCNIITRKIEVINTGTVPLILEEVLSGSMVLPFAKGEYRLTHLSGSWASETQIQQQKLTPGRKTLEGRLHHSGQVANPFFALELLRADGAGASENAGEIWFGGVEWSGNWKIIVEQVHVPYPLTRVSAGINNFDFSWELLPGQSFVTPPATFGYTQNGWSAMSQSLHHYQRNYLLPRRFAHENRPVLYNGWETVMFSVNEVNQMALAEKAARLGAEIFVVDDGWFGQRNSEHAGLGDWYVNHEKFPNGLNPLIKRVTELGMQFGIWVEPEMVNPDSDLYRAQPDWVYRFPNRKAITGRHQLILNLTRPDVQEYTFKWLDDLLSNHDIRYLKWDYNRAMSEPGMPGASLLQQRELWVRHITALYDIVDRLRQRHPQVWFEACSSGGGRAEMGSLAHFDQVWTSDNTDPLDRLVIQLGYSLVYAPATMYAWVTDTDRHQANFSLRYRFHSAFMGSLGIGADLTRWDESQMQEAQKLVAEYKTIRELIQHGDFYRLSGFSKDQIAVEYLAPNREKGIILSFDRSAHRWESPVRFCLDGLEPAAVYHLEGDLAPDEPTVLSGQALMYRGIQPNPVRSTYFNSSLIRFCKDG